MTSPEQLRVWTAAAIDVLNEIDQHHATIDNPADVALLLADLRDVKKNAGEVFAAVEAHLLSVMGEKTIEVEGLGVIESKRKTARKQWDNDGLWRVLVALALDERRVDEETGEYEPAHEAVARVLAECARPNWRVTPLRARGVVIDEWCIEEADGWSVALPPREVA